MIFILRIVGYLAAIPLIWQLGNWIVRLLLNSSGVQRSSKKVPAAGSGSETSDDVKAGHLIGLLERSLIVAGLLMNSWEIMTAVIALKTVARYKELDHQIAAEYFLIGSLASILWALIVAAALYQYDNTLGFHLFAHTELAPAKRLLEQFIYDQR